MSLPVWCRAAPDGTFIEIVVQPRASREGIGPVQGDRLKVRVHAPPVEDAANEAVVRLLAETLGMPRSAVTLAAGRTGRRKTVKIAGVGPEFAATRLAGGGP